MKVKLRRIKLIDNAPPWHRLWSIRFILLGTIFGALELSLPLWRGVLPDLHFAALSTACTLLAGVSRMIKQEYEKDDSIRESTDDPYSHN